MSIHHNCHPGIRINAYRNWRWIFLTLVAGLFFVHSVAAQRVVSVDECIARMREHSLYVKAEKSLLEAQKWEAVGMNGLPNPMLSMESPTGQFMTLGVTQTFDFPMRYVLQHRQNKTMQSLAEVDFNLRLGQAEYQLERMYIETSYQLAYCKLTRDQDSVLHQLEQQCEELFSKGIIGKLTRDMAVQKANSMRIKRLLAERELAQSIAQLNRWSAWDTLSYPIALDVWQYQDKTKGQGDLYLKSSSFQLEQSERAVRMAKQQALPGLMLGYMNQGPRGNPAFYGFQVGVTVPVWWWSHRAKIKSSQQAYNALNSRLQFEEQQRVSIIQSSTMQMQTLEQLSTEVALEEKSAVVVDASRLLEVGEIDFTAFVLLIDQSFMEREQWLQLKKEMFLLRSTLNYYN